MRSRCSARSTGPTSDSAPNWLVVSNNHRVATHLLNCDMHPCRRGEGPGSATSIHVVMRLEPAPAENRAAQRHRYPRGARRSAPTGYSRWQVCRIGAGRAVGTVRGARRARPCAGTGSRMNMAAMSDHRASCSAAGHALLSNWSTRSASADPASGVCTPAYPRGLLLVHLATTGRGPVAGMPSSAGATVMMSQLVSAPDRSLRASAVSSAVLCRSAAAT